MALFYWFCMIRAVVKTACILHDIGYINIAHILKKPNSENELTEVDQMSTIMFIYSILDFAWVIFGVFSPQNIAVGCIFTAEIFMLYRLKTKGQILMKEYVIVNSCCTVASAGIFLNYLIPFF